MGIDEAGELRSDEAVVVVYSPIRASWIIRTARLGGVVDVPRQHRSTIALRKVVRHRDARAVEDSTAAPIQLVSAIVQTSLRSERLPFRRSARRLDEIRALERRNAVQADDEDCGGDSRDCRSDGECPDERLA